MFLVNSGSIITAPPRDRQSPTDGAEPIRLNVGACAAPGSSSARCGPSNESGEEDRRKTPPPIVLPSPEGDLLFGLFRLGLSLEQAEEFHQLIGERALERRRRVRGDPEESVDLPEHARGLPEAALPASGG